MLLIILWMRKIMMVTSKTKQIGCRN